MQQTNGKTCMVQGRIVWVGGNLFKGQPKVDPNTKTPKLGKDGQPMTEYSFGLAVPKAVLGQGGPGQPGEIWTAMHEEAYSLYPSRQLPPGFAMKYKDGDGVDHKGVPFNQREGYAGHVVFTLSTTLPPKFFRFENGANILINEGIKCGDYVNVQVQIRAHAGQGQSKPGLYLNPNAVQFLGYGKEIINTPSGDQIFGTSAPPIPQGASSTPLVPQAGQLIPTPGAPVQSAQPVGFPQQPQAYPQAAPAFPQAAPPQPNWNVLPQAHQPQPAPAPAFPQAAAQPAGFPAVPGVPQ